MAGTVNGLHAILMCIQKAQVDAQTHSITCIHTCTQEQNKSKQIHKT